MSSEIPTNNHSNSTALASYQAFEQFAVSTPDAIALMSNNESLTYGQLNQRANQLAHVLLEKSVSIESIVPVIMDRSIDMLVALLAIHKAGGAYLPLPSDYPLKRIAHILQQVNAQCVVTSSKQLVHLDLVGIDPACIETICVDKVCVDNASTDNNPNINTQSNHLAYVIYTSGSTGEPKGVQIEQGNLSNLVKGYHQAFELTASDCSSHLSGVGFDATVAEIWPALSCGASICIIDDEAKLPSALLRCFETYQVTFAWVPTPLMEAIFQYDWQAANLKHLPRIITTAGAQLKSNVPVGFPSQIVNCYGPTENTVCTTIADVPFATETNAYSLPPIGKALLNQSVQIVDQHHHILPPNQEGEIWISGTSLARGYINNPAQNATHFVSASIDDNGLQRWYKSGDLGYREANGTVHFVSRIDEQLSIHGFRIELAEIESVLSSLPKVETAIVIAVDQDTPGGARLVAYLKLIADNSIDETSINEHLQQFLPTYMHPAQYICIETVPLNSSGKIDKSQLPSPLIEHSLTPQAQAKTPVQKQLAALFSTVLQCGLVDIHSKFFTLGGNSVAAIVMIGEIEKQWQIELSLVQFFSHSNIEQLSQLIEEQLNIGIQSKTKDSAKAQPIIIAQKQTSLSQVSLAQELVWFAHKLAPDNKAYHAKAMISLDGKLDIKHLEQSLQMVINRHEIYRTTFIEVDDQPFQQILQPWTLQLPLVDITSIAPNEQHNECLKLINQTYNNAFDLTNLPLVRWILVRLNAQHHALLHIEHHVVHDGWSYNIFLKELVALYRAYSEGKPSPLPEVAFQFADFANGQRRWLDTAKAQSQKEYWLEKLKDLPPRLARNVDEAHEQSQFKGQTSRIKLDRALWQRCETLCQQHEVTTFTYVLAVLNIVLSRYTNQEDISVGSGFANRNWPNADNILGMVLNTVVLRTSLADKPTFATLLKRSKETVVGALAHQEFPFAKVVEAVNPARQIGENPLFQVFLGFHDAPLQSLALPDVNIEVLEALSSDSSKFDLSLVVIPREEQQGDADPVHLIWEYNGRLFSQPIVDRLISSFMTVFEQTLAQPGRPISSYQLMTEEQSLQLLQSMNQTQQSLPTVSRVEQLFSQQAANNPDKVALIFGDASCSYQALHDQVCQTANYFHQLGIKQGELVGIYLDRGIDMVVTLLATHKIGAAYVPLDPDYPKARIQYIIEHSNMTRIITQQKSRTHLPQTQIQQLCLDHHRPDIEKSDTRLSIPAVAEQPNALAYVIYTSGSTGTPKGVAMSHRAFDNFIHAITSSVGIKAQDRLLAVTSLSFDIATLEIFAPLTQGGSVVIASTDDALSGEKLVSLIQQHQIDLMQATPTTWFSMLAQDWQPPKRFKALSAGEALPAKLANMLMGINVQLFNLYGPTETCVFSATYEVTSQSNITVPLGTPIANTQVYVLDHNMQTVPVGVVGQLWLGGDGLAEGYIHRPDLTAAQFVQNPYKQLIEGSSQRIYATGDLAHVNEDGLLMYAGRMDNQVKVRGFRIELAEIETTLSRHPNILEAVVSVAQTIDDSSILVAYIVLAANIDKNSLNTIHTDLEQYLKQSLPHYMLPQRYTVLDKFVLTPNKKIDRKALPKISMTPPAQREVVAPRNEIETFVFDKYQALFEQCTLSVNDDFFQLGGYSSLATQMIGQINREKQVFLTIKDFFDHSTPASLAGLIIQLQQLEQIDQESSNVESGEDEYEEFDI